MNVARARELAEAWRRGALRPEEERELQALLLDGGVLEAAERKRPTNGPLTAEARAWVRTTQTAAIEAMPSLRPTLVRVYKAGALRLGARDGSR